MNEHLMVGGAVSEAGVLLVLMISRCREELHTQLQTNG